MRLKRHRNHPRIRTSLGVRVGRLRLPTIVAVYALACVFAASLLAFTLTTASAKGMHYGIAFRLALATIFSPGEILLADGESPAYYLFGGFASLLGILLPIFLLSAFVFKLFQQDPIEWRKVVSLEPRTNGQSVLCFRFYNGTTSTLIRVSIQVIARVRSTGSPETVSNLALPLGARDANSNKLEASWPYARSGVPFTVVAALGEGLTAQETIDGTMVCLPRRDEAVDKRRVSFLVLVSGIMLDTGNPFFSAREYKASEDLLLGHFQEIGTDYETPPRTWPGWPNFDGNGEIYVFGYGSLVSPQSVESTLGHEVDQARFNYAILAGWRRSWNVASDKGSHPERTFRLADGSEYTGVTVVLGIEESRSSAGCNGSVFPVSRQDLSLLDVRERNYERREVTRWVTWAGKPDQCTVYTYVPTAEAMEKLAAAQASRRQINVRAGYVNLVHRAFAQINQLESYHLTTERPPFPVEEMAVEIEPALAPSIQRALSASYFGDAGAAVPSVPDARTAADDTSVVAPAASRSPEQQQRPADG
ncbi:gamma-glutamylcyclotransferase family protein [Micromonospora sp. NPDC047557]|uniref:gamma-glutamylcyclotransferase family protein n=1 Tax=Micromonospora sp. NPDC047557 TaxID=3364250 RepID=UPI00371840E6